MADDLQPPILPPTNPVMPNIPSPPPAQPSYGGDQNDLLTAQLLSASRMGQSTFADELARMHALAAQVQELQQQKAAIPQPKRGLQDEPWMKMQPITGQGMGADLGNLAKDVGRGILMGLGSTAQGRNLQTSAYAPGVNRYNTQQTNLAERIKELQGQQKTEEEVLPSAAGLQYHPYMAQASMMRAGADVSRAESYKKYTEAMANFKQQMMQLDWSKLSETQRHNKQDEMLRAQGVDVQRERNSVILSLGGQRIEVDKDKFDAAVVNKNQGLIDQLLIGVGLREPVGSGGQPSPVDASTPALRDNKSAAKPAPRAAKGGGNVPAGTTVYDPSGKPHRADGTAPLPGGWSLNKP